MSMIKEFRDFAMRGNVVDMAVGVVIGTAFGAITTSLVRDVMMPPLGYVAGNIDFADKKVVIQEAIAAVPESAITNAAGEVTRIAAVLAKPEITLNYGLFINSVINFLIVAFALFMVVKAMNKLKKKQEAAPAKDVPVPADVALLTEIRDILKKQ
jgi:large conductance mechanosensitive channel